MLVEIDSNYGADLDGNRGRMVVDFTLEPDDAEALLDGITGEYYGCVTVTLIDDVLESDVTFMAKTTDSDDNHMFYRLGVNKWLGVGEDNSLGIYNDDLEFVEEVATPLTMGMRHSIIGAFTL